MSEQQGTLRFGRHTVVGRHTVTGRQALPWPDQVHINSACSSKHGVTCGLAIVYDSGYTDHPQLHTHWHVVSTIKHALVKISIWRFGWVQCLRDALSTVLANCWILQSEAEQAIKRPLAVVSAVLIVATAAHRLGAAVACW